MLTGSRVAVLVVPPALVAADSPTPWRDQLLLDLDAARREALLRDAVPALGIEQLRQVAEAIRVRDELTFHEVHDPKVIAAYVDAALSTDAATRARAGRGAAWGGLLTPSGGIDAPTDVQLTAWNGVRIEVAPVVWAVLTSGADAHWVALTGASRDDLTVDPEIAGFEGANFRGPGFPLEGWTISRGGERLTEAQVMHPMLGQRADSCPDQRVALAYMVTGARKTALVAAAALSPGGGAGNPAMVVDCGATGVPDRPSASGSGAHLRWPCAPNALDPAAYVPVEATVPPRPDACLDRQGVDTLVVATNTHALTTFGMERFRVPPLVLSEVVLPAAGDPAIDASLFADPD